MALGTLLGRGGLANRAFGRRPGRANILQKWAGYPCSDFFIHLFNLNLFLKFYLHLFVDNLQCVIFTMCDDFVHFRIGCSGCCAGLS